jgi:hypothetical protein
MICQQLVFHIQPALFQGEGARRQAVKSSASSGSLPGLAVVASGDCRSMLQSWRRRSGRKCGEQSRQQQGKSQRSEHEKLQSEGDYGLKYTPRVAKSGEEAIVPSRGVRQILNKPYYRKNLPPTVVAELNI